MRDSKLLIGAFVKFKGKDHYQQIAKTTDIEHLYTIEEEFYKRADVENIYFEDMINGYKANEVFDIIEYQHDASTENKVYYYE